MQSNRPLCVCVSHIGCWPAAVGCVLLLPFFSCFCKKMSFDYGWPRECKVNCWNIELRPKSASLNRSTLTNNLFIYPSTLAFGSPTFRATFYLICWLTLYYQQHFQYIIAFAFYARISNCRRRNANKKKTKQKWKSSATNWNPISNITYTPSWSLAEQKIGQNETQSGILDSRHVLPSRQTPQIYDLPSDEIHTPTQKRP